MSEMVDLLKTIIIQQEEKERKKDIWSQSHFRSLPLLKSNNVGIVGEYFLRHVCMANDIHCEIDGLKTRKKGGGVGDGFIKDKTVEIKTAHMGVSGSFQHELGEHPWRSDYLIFVDVAPDQCFLTILKNFNEQHYLTGQKCAPHFPTKTVTRRKKQGNFKFDTTRILNEASKATLDITNKSLMDIGRFIETMIEY